MRTKRPTSHTVILWPQREGQKCFRYALEWHDIWAVISLWGLLTLHLHIPLEGKQQSPHQSSPKGKNMGFNLHIANAHISDKITSSSKHLNLFKNLSPTPPLFQARVREFCPSLREASSRIFPFTAMSSSPETMPPTDRHIIRWFTARHTHSQKWHIAS